MSGAHKPVHSDEAVAVTLAQARRQRRDIVSGVTMDEAHLIRFVEGPEGAIVPDLGRKLPGRGVWVMSQREDVDRARKQGLFARALKKKVSVAADLADQTEALLMRRLLSSLGLARKAAELVTGFEKVQAAIVSRQAAFIIEALDGAPDGRRKLGDARRRAAAPSRLIGLFASSDLGLALGAGNVVHIAFLAGRGAERWSVEVDRLAGFRPLCPEGWDF